MKPGDPIKVLVVEDSRTEAIMVNDALKARFASSVDTADTLALAREMLDAGAYDIVVLDLVLPDGNGLDLLAEITDMTEHPQAIIITGRGDEQTAIEAFRLGATSYVTKDQALPRVLGEAVEKALAEIALEQAREALRRSEERFRELAESLPEVIFEINNEGFFTYVNQNALDSFGYTTEEFNAGIHALDMVVEEEQGLVAERMVEIAGGGPTGGNEYTAHRKDGSTFPVIIHSVPIVHDGEIVGLRGILTDITEQRRKEEELKRINAELEVFAHTVSHDLRGPFAAIMGANLTIQNLLAIPDISKFRSDILDVAEAMDRSVAKAGALIEDLLSLAEVGQVPEDVSTVDISKLVDMVLEERGKEIRDNGIRVEISGDLGTVSANPTHMYQVFSNIIGNAIEHNTSKEPVVRIKYLGEEVAGGHRYLVKDNGEGIPPDIIDTIFLPFSKGASGGSGIGLSIVNKVISSYGGLIKVFNDNGACFEFVLNDVS